ncbi:MAG: hypothetical protein MUF61_02295 [archaeon]|jgi:hypothetical protein|nr:hypothetical protein [archaeon]
MAKIKVLSEVKPKIRLIEKKKEESLDEEIEEIEQDSINSRFSSSDRLSTGLISATESAQETPNLPAQPSAQSPGEERPMLSYGAARTMEEEKERKYGLERERNQTAAMGGIGTGRTAGIIRREVQPSIERGRISADRSQLFPQGEEEEEKYEARIPKNEPHQKKRLPWE